METGGLIEKIYNPGVGTYDVMVTTGPGYMTKRQEALDRRHEPDFAVQPAALVCCRRFVHQEYGLARRAGNGGTL